MKLFKKFFRNFRHFMERYFNIEIRILKNNIFRNIETPEIDVINYLSKSTGVLHIGAHRGSERLLYDWLGKKVI